MPNIINRQWKLRIFIYLYVSYIFFYLTRGSLSILGQIIINNPKFMVTGTQLGSILFMGGILYGVSKFLSGILVDLTSPKYLLSFGLISAGVVNCLIPMFSHNYRYIFILWSLNNLFQGLGWPSIAKLLVNWYEKKEIGVWWLLWSTSRNVGESLVAIFAIIASLFYFTIFSVFYFFGIISIIFGITLFFSIESSPEKAGIRKPIKIAVDERKNSFFYTLSSKVFTNMYIWSILISSIFLYFVRVSLSTWIVLAIDQNSSNSYASTLFVVLLQLGGFLGTLSIGFVSDKLFSRSRAVVCSLYMLLASISLMFLGASVSYYIVPYIFIFCIGFFYAGPIAMIGLLAAEVSGKESASTATGFIGLASYIASSTSHKIIPFILPHYFIVLFIASIISFVFLIPLVYFEGKSKSGEL